MRRASLLCLAALALVVSDGPPAAATASHRALFLGNSYSFGNQPNGVSGVYQAIAAEVSPTGGEIETSLYAKGGYTLADHAADATSSDTLSGLLGAEEGWDLIVLQDQSMVPGFGAGHPQFDASVVGLGVLDAFAGLAGAEVALLMTWGRRDGADGAWAGIYPDYSTMQELLAQGYATYQQEVSTEDRTAWVIPVGRAWQVIHDDLAAAGEVPNAPGTLFHALYTGDGSHPSALGSYLMGCVAYAAMTGRDPGTASWLPPGVDAATAPALQDAARRVVLDEPYTEVAFPWGKRWSLPWVQSWSDWYEAPLAGQPVEVEGGFRRPAVVVDGAVGVEHEIEVHDGRLALLDEQAALTAPRLEGPGRVDHRAGVVDVSELAATDYRLEGGTLRVEHVATALAHDAGQLDVVASTIVLGDYALGPAASLRVAAPGLDVYGAASLAGNVEVVLPDVLSPGPNELDLVVADTLELSGEGPAGVAWAIVEREDGRWALRVTVEGPPSPEPGPEPSPELGPEPVVEPGPEAAVEPGPEEDDGPAVAEEPAAEQPAPGGGGCGAAPLPAPLWLVVLGLVRRRHG